MMMTEIEHQCYKIDTLFVKSKYWFFTPNEQSPASIYLRRPSAARIEPTLTAPHRGRQVENKILPENHFISKIHLIFSRVGTYAGQKEGL